MADASVTQCDRCGNFFRPGQMYLEHRAACQERPENPIPPLSTRPERKGGTVRSYVPNFDALEGMIRRNLRIPEGTCKGEVAIAVSNLILAEVIMNAAGGPKPWGMADKEPEKAATTEEGVPIR